jgi:ubiquinone/menaquinone biosynthesis C-methylase UbiE
MSRATERTGEIGVTPEVQDYTRLAGDYDSTRYEGDVNTRKERFRRQALLELLPRRAERALDVACGTGRGVALLATIARVACGVDGTKDMLAAAKRKFDGHSSPVGLFQANAARLPFRDETFDAVTCLNFLHLFPDVREKIAFVSEIGRVTRPGGVVVIEFDNALQGVVLGIGRKYLGRDIGYDWPWIVQRSFPRDMFTIEAARGTNFPGTWRSGRLEFLERAARRFPLNYLANRIFIQARRK